MSCNPVKRLPWVVYIQSTRLIGVFIILITLGIIRWFFDDSSIPQKRNILPCLPQSRNISPNSILLYRRPTCTCTRPIRMLQANLLIIDETSPSFCSQYSTLRGSYQRIIAISMYGAKENALFAGNVSVNFLHELILDMIKTYPGWILRVYHDASIGEDIICPIECAHNHVDFCNASSLGTLGSVTDYMPPKMWRFLPVGDRLVDLAASRDLDSPLPPRELAAVNEWLSTDKQWHVMRDHPLHTVPMLGGMWSFRSVLNRVFADELLQKLLNRTLVARYGGRGDQTFLSDHVWPHIQQTLLAHDSYLCTTWYGKNSRPWPTRRPPLNDSGCFVGCIRPCCPQTKYPLGDCPMECRPVDHKDWTMC